MDEETLNDIMLLKSDKLLRPYAKLLIIIYKYKGSEYYTNILKEVLGGNYITLSKDGVLDGTVSYRKGKPPELTDKGGILAEALVKCWEQIKNKEKEILQSTL